MSSMKNYNYTKDNWWFLGELPPKNARYIVIDTETTGFSNQCNNVIELAAIEVLKGKLTGVQFHAYLRPRNPIDPKAQEKHKLGNSFFEDYFSDVYHSDKVTMENFLKFVGNSLIFAHNASFDYHFINNELKYWKLPIISKGRFRCTMRTFREIFSQVDVNYKKYCSLAKCCEYFNLKSSKYSFHTAIFDSFMTGRLLCSIYDYVETRINIENINNHKQSINFNSKIVDLQLLTNGNNIFKNNSNINYIHSNNINSNKIDSYNAQNKFIKNEAEPSQKTQEKIEMSKTETEKFLMKDIDTGEEIPDNVFQDQEENENENETGEEKIFTVFKIDKLTTKSTSPQKLQESPQPSYSENNCEDLNEVKQQSNTFDNDILFLQEYEGVIQNYMKEDDKESLKQSEVSCKSNLDGKEHHDAAVFERPDPNSIISNELSKEFIENESEENHLMKDFDINNSENHKYEEYFHIPSRIHSEPASFPRSNYSDEDMNVLTPNKQNKYKELMRKFVNAFNRASEFGISVDHFNDENRDDLIQLNMEDIEEIIRDNL